jgi:SMEK domain-containing protein
MITRGHFIGEIIDNFSELRGHIELRVSLGLTDLPVYAENFIRDVLNIIEGRSLESLNKTRSNNPGLDLGDKVWKVGIQVTATSSSAKVYKTLSKITTAQKLAYKKIIIVILGAKQGSYKLNATKLSGFSFNKQDIWDLSDLARKSMDLDSRKLQDLHELVQSECMRLKNDLEVRKKGGKYKTDGYAMWELPPQPQIGDGKKFVSYLMNDMKIGVTSSEKKGIAQALVVMGDKLTRLPRVTREFLVSLMEHRRSGDSKRFGELYAHLLYSVVERKFQGVDLDGELGILAEAGFVEVNGEESYDYGPAEIGVTITECYELATSFFEFIDVKKLNLRQVVGEVNLSGF